MDKPDTNFVKTPESLWEAVERGEMPYSMFCVLGWLHRRSRWEAGVVRYASAKIISRFTKGTFAERTVQRDLNRAEMQGYITCDISPGVNESYPIMLHNYNAAFRTEDGTATRVINPREIRPWKAVRAAGRKKNREIVVAQRRAWRVAKQEAQQVAQPAGQASPGTTLPFGQPGDTGGAANGVAGGALNGAASGDKTSLIETSLVQTSLMNESKRTGGAAAAAGVAAPLSTANCKSRALGLEGGRPAEPRDDNPVEPMAPPYSEEAQALSEWFWSQYQQPNSESSCAEFEKLLKAYPNLSILVRWAFEDGKWGKQAQVRKGQGPPQLPQVRAVYGGVLGNPPAIRQEPTGKNGEAVRSPGPPAGHSNFRSDRRPDPHPVLRH